MSAPAALVMVVGGIALLYVGGEGLVRGSVGLARLARVSTAVIGLTVVSIGTSLPELAVSLLAALEGSPDVGMGNIVGSNIFNVGLIAGISAIVFPIAVRSETIKLEWPFMFAASLLALVIARDLRVDRLEGTFLLLALMFFVAYVVHSALRNPHEHDSEEPLPRAWPSAALVAVGVLMLTGGAQILVTGAVALAGYLGLSERVVGLTIVAMGTSLPELAAAFVAATKREGELALGNVIGSNIFNLLGILGTVAVIHPIPVNEAIIRTDMLWMIGFSFILFPMMFTRRLIGRGEGAALLLGFTVYLFFVFR